MIFFRSAFAKQASPSPTLINKESALSVRKQCELLGINRSSLYYRRVQPSKEEMLLKEHLMARIDYHHTNQPYMGTRKLSRLLKSEGLTAGRKLVRSLMAEMGLRAICPKPNLSKRDFKAGIVPYLLRGAHVSFPNQVWSVDITYIQMAHSHMYLTAIIDWYSRKIVGWSLSDTLDTKSVIEAVTSAIEAEGVPGIINSDQGTQFTSSEYKALLKSFGIRQSMDGKSRWADNIMIKRWFRSLKTEEIYPNEYSSPRELRIAIREYIYKYNFYRPHQSLDYRTPQVVFDSCFKAA